MGTITAQDVATNVVSNLDNLNVVIYLCHTFSDFYIKILNKRSTKIPGMK